MTDFVINPKTQRPIKVGQRTWIKLVNQGILEDTRGLVDYDPEDVLEEEIEEKINILNETLPENIQAVKGRGSLKNKIVKRLRQNKNAPTRGKGVPKILVEEETSPKRFAEPEPEPEPTVSEDELIDLEATLRTPPAEEEDEYY